MTQEPLESHTNLPTQRALELCASRAAKRRKKKILAPFGTISSNCFHRPEKYKKSEIGHIFIVGPMGPIHLVLALAAIHLWCAYM